MASAGKVAVVLSVLALLLVGLLVVELDSLSGELEGVNSRIAQVAQQVQALGSAQAQLAQVSTVTVTRQTTVVERPLNEPLNVSEIYERAKDSVVMVRVIGTITSAVGTGFVYDSRGHIVTNYHVVSGGDQIYVSFLDGTMLQATLVGYDVDTDLAVLRIRPPSDLQLKPLPLGDSRALRIGDPVVAIGNPFGLQGSVTVGIVSQKGRLLPSNRGYLIPWVIQIDAAINPGNSGGPLLNYRGEVVGVTTAIETTTGTFSGVGYAIPSSIVARVVPVLIEKGRYSHSYIGISGKELNSLVAERAGIPVKSGFLVETVANNSPASRAGLRGGTTRVTVAGETYLIGGDVIVAIDGHSISSLDDLLTYLVENTSPGDRVVLTVIRDGKAVNVEVVLGERP
ncbi:MAG: trypsin-like peptidase domain-containing protein [Aigarchaeota archaeon]|nr:trypsin-like peptidase domain-containing protein [Candidatus Calditenuis fumarioli]